MHSYDERREIAVAQDRPSAEEFAAAHWIACAKEAVDKRGFFNVALSGGSTPAAIYRILANEYAAEIDWNKVRLFWSDERSVPPTDRDSNYKMSMDAGLSQLGIPSTHIFRMLAEEGDRGAKEYEDILKKYIPDGHFDLVMLGMGDDGHTASLFPHTKALEDYSHLVTMNYIESKSTWRMTLTYPCINLARNIAIYVLGEAKADMVEKVLKGNYHPKEYPVQKVGTSSHKALWIMDIAAASKLHLPESACLS